MVKQFFQQLVEVEVPAGQLASLQPLAVPVVVEMELVRRTSTGQVLQELQDKASPVAMVSPILSSPQVVVVAPADQVVLEAENLLETEVLVEQA